MAMTYPDFNAIKNFYGMKLWTKEMVGDGVRCNAITADQYKTITGEDYADGTEDTAQTTTDTPAPDNGTATPTEPTSDTPAAGSTQT